MDAKDFRLLVALHEDARASYRSLGRRVSLTAPAVRDRLARLGSFVGERHRRHKLVPRLLGCALRLDGLALAVPERLHVELAVDAPADVPVRAPFVQISRAVFHCFFPLVSLFAAHCTKLRLPVQASQADR